MQLWLRELSCMLRPTYIACHVFYFLHSLLSIAVTECNQQPHLRYSIDRSLPAAEQRTVLPTAQWVVPFLLKVMDFFFVVGPGVHTFSKKKIYWNQLKLLGVRRAVVRSEFCNGGPQILRTNEHSLVARAT